MARRLVFAATFLCLVHRGQPLQDLELLQRAHIGIVGEATQKQELTSELTFQNAQYSEMAPALSLPLVLVIGVCGFIGAGLAFPYVPPVFLSFFVCGAYIAISVTIDIFIGVQKSGGKGGHGYAFNPACSVLMTEAVKLVISTIIYLNVWWSNAESAGKPLIPKEFTLGDVKWLSLPAVIFTVNNILVYACIGKNDMAAFGVFRDTMIFWTAAIWKMVFRVDLGWTRMTGIMIIFAGLFMNKAASMAHGSVWSWMFLWVLLMTFCNASGSVANEFALKRNKGLDINLQNMVLYTACIMCSAIFLLATDAQRLSSAGNFFAGFDNRTYITVGLQALAGLMVSRLLKYTDAVMKTVATCLRGPTMVIIAPIFMPSPRDAATVISACVVAGGCFTYLTMGPLNTAAAAKTMEDPKIAGTETGPAKK